MIIIKSILLQEVCQMCVLSKRNGTFNVEASFRLYEAHMWQTSAYLGQLGRFLVKFCVFGKCEICPRICLKWDWSSRLPVNDSVVKSQRFLSNFCVCSAAGSLP